MHKMLDEYDHAGGSTRAAAQSDLPQADDGAPAALACGPDAIGRRRFLGLGSAAIAASVAGVPARAALPARGQMRATWVTSVLNLDWPSAASARVADPVARVMLQQQELLAILDQAQALYLNTLVFQVKPCADALYRSRILPWSPVLTGVHGKDPGFDPLAFLLRHAHARGIQVHAWLNPYRVSTNISQATRDALSAASRDSPPACTCNIPSGWGWPPTGWCLIPVFLPFAAGSAPWSRN